MADMDFYLSEKAEYYGNHGHNPTYVGMEWLDEQSGLAVVTAGGSCSSCWQVGHDKSIPPFPIGAVVVVERSPGDDGEVDDFSVITEFPGVVSAKLVQDFLDKKAQFQDLRAAVVRSVRNSTPEMQAHKEWATSESVQDSEGIRTLKAIAQRIYSDLTE